DSFTLKVHPASTSTDNHRVNRRIIPKPDQSEGSMTSGTTSSFRRTLNSSAVPAGRDFQYFITCLALLPGTTWSLIRSSSSPSRNGHGLSGPDAVASTTVTLSSVGLRKKPLVSGLSLSVSQPVLACTEPAANSATATNNVLNSITASLP